jgi:enamine deaminase RidA (YjgF/YER057c/UK114 family)
MHKEYIDPPGVLKHPAFTRVITVSGPMKLIFMSGQTPQGDDFGPVFAGDYRAQYLFVMEKIARQLAAVGASWDDVTHRRTYTLDVDKLRAVTRDPTLPKFYRDLPCSTMVGVTRLSDPGFLLEVEVIAVTAP